MRCIDDVGVLAVEMQAASLFAFATARGSDVAMVALVSNSVDETASFDTGGNDYRVDVLAAIVGAAKEFMSSSRDEGVSGATDASPLK